MISIRNQDCVCKSHRESWVIRFSANSREVVLASQERPDAKEDRRFVANVLRYDVAALTHDRRKLECEVTHSGTEIRDDTTFAEIQRLDYVGWTLPTVSFAFDSVQRIESSNALVEIAQQDEQQHSSHQEQRYPNAIRSLDSAIGYRNHERERNSLTAKSCNTFAPQKRSRLGGDVTLVSQLNGVRLGSEPGHWYGAKRRMTLGTGGQDRGGFAGPELTGETPQAI